jgi:prolyl oligopeptidase
LAWLERGGVYVEGESVSFFVWLWVYLVSNCLLHNKLTNKNNEIAANIRGGGEFGPAWHQAALLDKRHKAYEDFAAVGEHLIESNICTPKTLAIRGGSNGGLLVANMYVMRPDLFGAIHCAVPLLDMQRYHTLLAGASWIAEYGNPENDWENFLHKYSPYHNIQPGTKYPPILVTTSTRDDRVVSDDIVII